MNVKGTKKNSQLVNVNNYEQQKILLKNIFWQFG